MPRTDGKWVRFNQREVINWADKRNILFAIVCIIALFMIYEPIRFLLFSSDQSEYYSHIVLIPLIVIYLMYQERREIFMKGESSHRYGIPLMVAGIAVLIAGRILQARLNQNDFACVVTLGAVILIIGSFLLLYGVTAFKSALFPLLFLFFMVPVPGALMDAAIHALRRGSTEFSSVLFQISGVSFLREGFTFHLPGASIEVAKQCSGIRSSLALLITGVLSGHLFLNSWSKKLILIACIVPIMMLKNGLRILSLTLLGVYVDARILTNSALHTDGGILFFALALFLLAPILIILRRAERLK